MSKNLRLKDREKIERMYMDGGQPIRQIAYRVNVSLPTIYRELRRGCTGQIERNGRYGYSAQLAQERAVEAAHRKGMQSHGKQKED